MECPIPNKALGTKFNAACKQAEILNGQFGEWDDLRKGLPVTGVSMPRYGNGSTKPFAFSTMQHKVQRMRKKLKLPANFTLDA